MTVKPKKSPPSSAEYRAKKEAQRERAKERKAARLKERSRHLVPDFMEHANQIKDNAYRMRRYLSYNTCKKSEAEKARLLLEMRSSDGPLLGVNNPAARIRFYAAMRPHVNNFSFGESSYLFTFAPEVHAFPMSQAGKFEKLSLKNCVIQALRGYHGWFVIESGLHTNLPPYTADEPWISFHVHGVILGRIDGSETFDLDALKAKVDDMTRRYPAFRPNRDSAQIKPVGNLATLLGYLLKESNTEYRLKTSDDAATVQDDKFVPDPLFDDPGYVRGTASPGMQLRMREITRGWLLDKMIFGIGDGVAMVDKVVADALSMLTSRELLGDRFRHVGKFEPAEDVHPSGPADTSGWLHAANQFLMPDVHVKIERKSKPRTKKRVKDPFEGL